MLFINLSGFYLVRILKDLQYALLLILENYAFNDTNNAFDRFKLVRYLYCSRYSDKALKWEIIRTIITKFKKTLNQKAYWLIERHVLQGVMFQIFNRIF